MTRPARRRRVEVTSLLSTEGKNYKGKSILDYYLFMKGFFLFFYINKLLFFMARVEYSTVKMKRSNVPGKVPTDPSTVDYGELLVNYAEGKEFVAMKNSKNEFVKIVAHPDAGDVSFNGDHSNEGFTGKTVESSIQQIESEMLNNEKTVAGSLNDLNERIEGLSLGDKNIIEGIQRNGADLTPDSNKKVNIAVPTDAADITFSKSHNLAGLSGNTVEKSITDIEQRISDNENTISASLNGLTSKTNELNTKIESLNLGDKNVIEKIQLNGSDLPVINKAVNIEPNAIDVTFTASAHIDTGFTGDNVQTVLMGIEQVIIDNEQATAAALTEINDRLGNKVDAVSGKTLTTNDFTDDLKAKLDGIDLSLYSKKRTVEKVLPDNIGFATSGGTAQTVTLDANKFFIIGNCSGLTVNLPDTASDDCLEYCCQFYVPTDSFTLTMPSTIYWQDGTVPTFEGSTCYQMVIINNCATIGLYKATS